MLPPPVVDTPLDTFFAVQLLPGESDLDVIHRVFQASMELRKFFRRLEVLDIIVIGERPFLRCRTDRADMSTILQEITDRGTVLRNNGSYVVTLVGGRTGKVEIRTMHAPINMYSKKLVRKMYRGTKIKGWENQFPI